jgi:hypothetical protein
VISDHRQRTGRRAAITDVEDTSPDDQTENLIEAPEADVAEQRRGIVEYDDTAQSPFGGPVEADPFDVADQRRPVPLDDEDYA